MPFIKGRIQLQAAIDAREKIDHRISLYRYDLRGMDLSGLDLTRSMMQRCDLRGVNLQRTYLTDSNLDGSDLRAADLRGADFTNVALVGVDLRGADLTGADVRVTDFSGARLDGAILERVMVDRWTEGLPMDQGVCVAPCRFTFPAVAAGDGGVGEAVLDELLRKVQAVVESTPPARPGERGG
jgi:hypothetical protein